MKSKNRKPTNEASQAEAGQAETQKLRKSFLEFLSFGLAPSGLRASGFGFLSDFSSRISVFIFLALLCATTCLRAQMTNRFPAHWGPPPRIETRDLRKLPGDYGFGSSTLARWIQTNLDKDQRTGGGTSATQRDWRMDFQQAELGQLPEGITVQTGLGAVKAVEGNRFLEVAPTAGGKFRALVGPALDGPATVSARVAAVGADRSQTQFGVGLGGTNGWRLVVVPGKNELELWRGQGLESHVSLAFQAGAWTSLRLQVSQLKNGAWQVAGKAWLAGGVEPKDWLVASETPIRPAAGRASLVGSTVPGALLQFDDLVVSTVVKP